MKRRLGFFSWIVVALILIGAIYAGVAALEFLWWGPGFAGSLAGRYAPRQVRTMSRVYIYDHVIVVERDRVIFRRAMWASARFALLLGFAASIGVLLLRKRGAVALLAGVLLAGATFGISRSRARDVVLPRGSPREVIVRGYDVGGGRSGTRNTTPTETGYDIVDAATAQVLVQLPWNEEPDARFWRDLVAEKIAARPLTRH